MPGILLAFVVLVALWEIPRLVAKGWWRELIVTALLLAVGFLLSLLLTLGVQLPYLSPFITRLIKGLFGLQL